jgi:pimeloyl-ACP methyl ester carboxylesterase
VAAFAGVGEGGDRLPRLPGRLAEDEAFPHAWPGHRARALVLAGGERARVVECLPPDGGEDAPAVLFIHGWGCLAYAWRRNLQPVATAGYRALAPDLRGHGWSDKPPDDAAYTTDALADMVRGVLDAAGVERALVVGHSMGAAIALRLAQRAPTRVAGLVLACPVGFGGVARTWWLQRCTPPLLDPWLPRLATRPVIGLGLRSGYGRLAVPTARDVDEYWAPTADPRFAPAMRRIAHAFGWGVEPAAALRAIAGPVQVLFAERDNVIRERDARTAVAHLARAHVQVVPGAGHVLPEEAPAVLNAAILAAAAEAFASATPAGLA